MLKRLFFIIILGASSSIFAQSNLLKEDDGFGYVIPSFTVSTLETTDWLQTSLFSFNSETLAIGSLFRIDEEVPYSDSNKALINELYFIDLQIEYVFKNLTLSLKIENLLNMFDTSFEIEPEYVDVYETVSVFTQQPTVLLNIAIVYTF